MAKKKIKKHKGGRRRIGAKGSISTTVLKGVGLVAGGLATAFGVQAVNTAIGPTAPKVAAPLAFTVVGLVVPHITKGSPMVEGLGFGMTAVGGVMAVNELGLSVPGVSGMAMSSNASPMTNVLRQAVGAGPMQRGNGFLNRAVGRHPVGALGALISD